jgi:gas vesicle protein
MGIQSLIPGTLLLLGALVGAGALAQAPQASQEKRELIYCADRMTHEEREAYRAKMRAAATLAEKDALRAAHRTEMQARARSQGVTDCEPPGRQWRGGSPP